MKYKQQNFSYTGRRGKIFWIFLILLILLVSCFIYVIFLYLDIQESKTAGFEETERQIIQATSITEIEKIEQFNGAEAYHVIFGKNEDNEEKIIFYPLEGNEKTLTTVEKNEIVLAETIKSGWSEQCTGCEFINIVPAMVDDEPLWELAYNDDSNRYILDYLSMYDGSRYEQYRFNRMFN
ncbi:uncharacterized protein YpmB [Virgibacillus natechei]|uniref:Uncharacterized protein YpmB n=1 Tax=Virgibacillus natechei TaxID=1216297 RepID=A0ABS4IF75_9BACI|nr:DUF5590 domain-containing protein [Virgibacillus natechei]MBP1969583.1 uncharacterized protein YpmB [Virgibacillus natechei]UZD14811.1 DUF5590 domain-containing protein [Virgibacillus natechei]